MGNQDNITLITFSTSIHYIVSNTVSNIRSTINNTIDSLIAEGSTCLYDVVIDAYSKISSYRTASIAKGLSQNYAIVLMSDGLDTSSSNTKDQMIAALPTSEDATGTHIYTIAYGADADKETLIQIASQTNGNNYTATTSNIASVYFAINAEI